MSATIARMFDGETVTTIDVLPSKGKQGFRLLRERIKPKRGVINLHIHISPILIG